MNTKRALLSILLGAAMLPVSVAPVSNVSAATSTTSAVSEKEISAEDVRSEICSDMDISKTSGVSKDRFCKAIKDCPYDSNGVLEDNAETIWDICQECNLNEFAFVGIIAGESGWCTSRLSVNNHNIMSIKKHGSYAYFDTYEDCIEYTAHLLSDSYINPKGRYHTGGNLKDIGYTYAGSSYAYDWAKLVSDCANKCAETLK